MAKYTRGAVKIDWLRKPKVEIADGAAMNIAPRWPMPAALRRWRGWWLQPAPPARASAGTPSSHRCTTPPRRALRAVALGQVFLWLLHFRREEICRLPSSVGEQHWHHGCPKRCQRPVPLSCGGMVPCLPLKANPATTSAAMATIFITMSTLCVCPPVLTPRQLMSVRIASAAVATIQSGACTRLGQESTGRR